MHTSFNSPSSIAQLRKMSVEKCVKRTVLKHMGVPIAMKILELQHEWFGNSSMVGRIADVFSSSEDGTPSITV